MTANDDLLDRFCDALWLEDGLSRNTLSGYHRDLRQFAEWMAKRGGTLRAAQRADLLGYLAYRFQGNAKPRSAARLLSSLKRFYRYLLREGKIGSDPTLQIEAPKLPRSLPKGLTEDDVVSLLAAPHVETLLGLRDRAMLETLYASGLRVSELVGLKTIQVDRNAG
ncbi:MAG TPA: site-specific integrase, partial [Burkholderiales bacterium]|nr:site-specific integrase [Burkholderiales bacterium]